MEETVILVESACRPALVSTLCLIRHWQHLAPQNTKKATRMNAVLCWQSMSWYANYQLTERPLTQTKNKVHMCIRNPEALCMYNNYRNSDIASVRRKVVYTHSSFLKVAHLRSSRLVTVPPPNSFFFFFFFLFGPPNPQWTGNRKIYPLGFPWIRCV